MEKYIVKFGAVSKQTALKIGKLVIDEIPEVKMFTVQELKE